MADPGKKRRRHQPLSVKVSIQGAPELMATLRRDMAQLLRDAADDEPPAVAARLREIAAVFETGLGEDL